MFVSLDEQKKRLAERLERPDKYWKYNPADIDERLNMADVPRGLPGDAGPDVNGLRPVAHRAVRPEVVQPAGHHRAAHRGAETPQLVLATTGFRCRRPRRSGWRGRSSAERTVVGEPCRRMRITSVRSKIGVGRTGRGQRRCRHARPPDLGHRGPCDWRSHPTGPPTALYEGSPQRVQPRRCRTDCGGSRARSLVVVGAARDAGGPFGSGGPGSSGYPQTCPQKSRIHAEESRTESRCAASASATMNSAPSTECSAPLLREQPMTWDADFPWKWPSSASTRCSTRPIAASPKSR